MFKTTIAAAAAAVAFAPAAALADPTLTVEAPTSYPDGEYSSATTDVHLGYAGGEGKVGYYVQEDLLLFTPSLMMTTRLNFLVRSESPMLLPRPLESMANSLVSLMVKTLMVTRSSIGVLNWVQPGTSDK